MRNKSLIKFFLFVTLLLLLIGFASAAVESNDTTQSIEKNEDYSDYNAAEVSKTESDVTDNVILIEDNNNQSKPTPTTIGINSIDTTAFTENVSISGKFTDINGRNLIKTPLNININGKSFTTKTDTEGYYSYDFKTNAVGINNVTVSYHGNSNFAATTSSITFNVVAQSTKITVDKIDDVDLNNQVTISGRYVDKNGVLLTKTSLKIYLNDLDYTTKTDDNGEYSLTVKVTQAGENNVTVSYPGNIRYSGANDTTTFYVRQATKMSLNAIKDTMFTDKVIISGKYTDNDGVLLTRTNVWINVNGKIYKTKTDDSGLFTLSIVANTLGVNNVSVSYPGNTKYTGASDSKSFNVIPCDTIITVDNIKNAQYSDKVSVTGKYTDKNGVLLTNTNVWINVNGKTYKTKTDNDGKYALDIVANTIGVNNVSVSYPGNARYNSATDKTTFNVSRKDTIITLNKISNVYSDWVLSISGKYTDINGKSLIRTPLSINLNGFSYTTKTDDNGQFSYNTQSSMLGVNNVSVSYQGNQRYSSAQAKTTFNVVGRSDILTINAPETQYTDTISITGKHTDKNGKAYANAQLTLTINGKKYTTKTDSNGNYVINYKTSSLGVNNVSMNNYGNDLPLLTNKTTFNVIKKDTRLSIDPISNATLGTNITIKGKYTDTSGNPLKSTTVSLVVNDAKYGVKTDENGTFQVKYETFVSGVNHIEAYYRGTEKYSGTSLNATFNVTTPLTGRFFKTRKTMVASVFASGTITSEHVTKWVNSGITDVYVRATEYDNDTSLLRKTINLCRNTNIKVHAWVIVFRDNGKWDNSVTTQNKMKRFLKQVMEINGVEGVCLDYIRYSGTNPSIVQTSVITNFLKDVNYIAKNIDPRMEVSACVMPEITNLKYYYGQDLKAMENYVDYMICMAYKNNYYQDTAWMVDVTKSLLKQVKHAKVVTSLTTYSDMYGRVYLPLSEITSDIKAILNAGSYGYSLFSKSTTPVYPKIF